MELGLVLPSLDAASGIASPWDTLLTWVRRAESLGLSSLWVRDRLPVRDQGPSRPPVPGGDALVTLAALARATAKVRLGSLVLPAPLRPPAVAAKALATIDRLSRGRLVIGLGAGACEAPFRVAGVPFGRPGDRLARLAEAVQILRGAFAGEPFTFRGEHYGVEGMRCRPRPVQEPGPPIWLGGKGPGLLRLAAGCADGWNLQGRTATVDDYRRRAAALERSCEQAGRDPATVSRSVSQLLLVAESDEELSRRRERAGTMAPVGPGGLVGTVDQVREQVAAWDAAGVTTLIVDPVALPLEAAGAAGVELVAAALT